MNVAVVREVRANQGTRRAQTVAKSVLPLRRNRQLPLHQRSKISFRKISDCEAKSSTCVEFLLGVETNK